MNRAKRIAIAAGTALVLGLAASTVSAQAAEGTEGPSYGPGYGMMGGYGPGPGAMGGPGYGPGWGRGHMGGYGPGYGPGRRHMDGYGPGYGSGWGRGHMGGYGPGYGPGRGHMGGYGPGYGMGWGHRHMGGYGPGFGPGSRGGSYGCYANADQRLSALKSELGITAKQDAAWTAFEKSAKEQHKTRLAWFAKMHEEPRAQSAPERLEQRAEFMKQREAELEAHAMALKNLYAVLTPEQKAIANMRFGGFGPGHGQGYGRHGWRNR